MNNKFVIGHKNPDTDSVVSAIMLSWLLKEQGQDFEPAAGGDTNKETNFVLSHWGFEKPTILEDGEGKEFFLVDHNEMGQSIATAENVCGVIDHHLIGGLKTSLPIYFRVEPVGSTATLIYKLIKERGFSVSKKQGGLLLSAVISDTLNLNSPTTTTEDIDTFYELKEISQCDTEKLSTEMFAAKSDFSDKSIEEVITADLKEYDFNEKKIGIGVAETTSLKYFHENSQEILATVKKVKEEGSFDSFFLSVIDIINQDSYFYLPSKEEEGVIKEVFSGEERDGFFFVKGVSSRKKEIAPPLSEYYGKL